MNISDYAEVVFKGLGAALVTHICSAICRETGRSSLADGVEFAGKIEILLLSLPLVRELLSTVSELMSLG